MVGKRVWIGFLTVLMVMSGQLTSTAQNLGNINGFVRQSKTLVPLQGVTIKVVGTDKVTSTDEKGFFSIREIPTKSYTIEASSIGYKPVQKFDIEVTSGNTVEVNFDLEEETRELGNIVIRANFPKPVGVVNSVQSLSANEIIRYPGANFDMAKVVQSLPGVSGSVGFRNDIIIRGGAPNENVYTWIGWRFRPSTTLPRRVRQEDLWACSMSHSWTGLPCILLPFRPNMTTHCRECYNFDSAPATRKKSREISG